MATSSPFAAIEACFANDRALISALIEEKHALRIELTAVKAELRTQQRLTELARDVSRSHDRSRSPISIAKSPSFYHSSTHDETEKEARDLFRDILTQHYVDGHPCGKDADDWLRKHGGWFPDPQELYDDGTSLPKDEGLDVRRQHPAALEEAFNLITKLDQWLLSANLEDMSDDLHRYISNKIKKLRSKNPTLAPV